MYLLAVEANLTWAAPRSWGDAAGWVNCVAHAGDLFLLANSKEELLRLCRELLVCKEWGLGFREDTVRGSNLPGDAARLGRHKLKPQPSMESPDPTPSP